MSLVLSSFLLVLIPFSLAFAGVEGEYQTISESEWSITLNLKKNGTGKIVKENWEAGEFEKRVKTIIPITWKQLPKNVIQVKHKLAVEKLKLDADLVFDKEIKDSKGIGLVGIESKPQKEGILLNNNLWLKPIKFIKND